MRNFILRAALVIGVLTAVILPAAQVSAAYNPFGDTECLRKASDSAVCRTPTGVDPVTGPNGVIRKITTFIAVVAGVAAVIIIVLAGIRYITSNGDAEQVAKAKRTIIMAVVGLVVIAAGQSIINLILSRL